MATNHLHYNAPQIRSQLVAAPVEYDIMGRGTGKTEGILAPRLEMFFNQLPRSAQVIVGATYVQILTRTLPGLIYGLEKRGYRRGIHYLIGERPNERWRRRWSWKGPFRPPEKWDYTLTWWNGAIAHFVSQDRVGSSNGISIDGVHGDEAKLLNREKLARELLPANRGFIKDFEGNPYHHGITFTTDMPMGTSGRWLLDMREKMQTARIQELMKLQVAYQDLRKAAATASAQRKAELQKKMQWLVDEMTDIRMGDPAKREEKLLYYQEASSLENIHALGFDYIKDQLREASVFEFDTQILNKRPFRLEDGFYPDLVEEIHGYFAYDYGHIEGIGYNFDVLVNPDCRQDADVKRNEPLHISLDYNRRIHPLVVGQPQGKELRALKGLHSLYPGKLKEVLDEFNRYYRFHGSRTIYYWYDHTAIGELRSDRICDEVIDHLNAAGWNVVPCYIGKANGHETRYRMWGHLLKETGKYPMVFRYNRDNCPYLALSMFKAQAERRKNGFGKDKGTEKDPLFPAEESTHYSEAIDTLAYGILESGIDYASSTAGLGFLQM